MSPAGGANEGWARAPPTLQGGEEVRINTIEYLRETAKP